MWTPIEYSDKKSLFCAAENTLQISEGGNDDAIQTSQAHLARGGTRGGMKKHVELDAQGQPFGPIKKVLCIDIKKYAKDLDPTTE